MTSYKKNFVDVIILLRACLIYF